MFLSLLAPRILARNVALSSRSHCLRNPVSQITRSFSVTGVACARATATATASKKKSSATGAKKSKAKKPAKKKVAAKKKKAAKPKVKKVKKPAKPAKVHIPRGRPELKPPKRPGNSYSFFISKYYSENRPESPVSLEDSRAVFRDGAATWRAYTEEQKRPFVEQVAAATAEYEKRLKEYIKNTDSAILKEINKRREKRGKMLVRVHVPVYSGYLVYLNEQRALRPTATSLAESQEITKELGKGWQALSDNQKANYRQLALERNASIQAEL